VIDSRKKSFIVIDSRKESFIVIDSRKESLKQIEPVKRPFQNMIQFIKKSLKMTDLRNGNFWIFEKDIQINQSISNFTEFFKWLKTENY